jgi:hypothetical protein
MRGAAFHIISVGPSISKNIASEILDIKTFVLIFIKIMSTAQNPHSQSAVLRGIFFTAFVKGGKATGNLPLPPPPHLFIKIFSESI